MYKKAFFPRRREMLLRRNFMACISKHKYVHVHYAHDQHYSVLYFKEISILLLRDSRTAKKKAAGDSDPLTQFISFQWLFTHTKLSAAHFEA